MERGGTETKPNHVKIVGLFRGAFFIFSRLIRIFCVTTPYLLYRMGKGVC